MRDEQVVYVRRPSSRGVISSAASVRAARNAVLQRAARQKKAIDDAKAKAEAERRKRAALLARQREIAALKAEATRLQQLRSEEASEAGIPAIGFQMSEHERRLDDRIAALEDQYGDDINRMQERDRWVQKHMAELRPGKDRQHADQDEVNRRNEVYELGLPTDADNNVDLDRLNEEDWLALTRRPSDEEAPELAAHIEVAREAVRARGATRLARQAAEGNLEGTVGGLSIDQLRNMAGIPPDARPPDLYYTPQDLEAQAADAYMAGTLGWMDPQLAVLAMADNPNQRFMDQDGNYADPKTGRRYSYEDYVDPATEGMLAPVLADMGFVVEEGRWVEGRPRVAHYGRGPEDQVRIKTRRYDTPEVMTDWQFLQQLVAWERDDPDRLAAFQKGMWEAGYFDDEFDEHPELLQFGRLDQRTLAATSDFLETNQWENKVANQGFNALLAEQSTFRGERLMMSKAGGGGGGANAYAVTDEVALAAVVERTAQALVGRALSPEETSAIVAQIRAMEVAEGQKTSGAIANVSPEAQAGKLIRERFGEESQAHDIAGAFEMFSSILGEGGGLGQGNFGQSTVGPQVTESR